jgi:non-specific serine/threonine protein kinase
VIDYSSRRSPSSWTQAVVPYNLPTPRTSLIGRERDASEVGKLVLESPERLVTLTGVGGCGKTRLALQIALDVRDAFADGVWLVELAPISDPLLVPQAVAAALGVREGSGRLSSMTDTLIGSLQQRQLLLVLDNCEHLIDACANLADRLLQACPELRILATSREPLHIAGERQRRVHPLPVPDSEQAASPPNLARCPSVHLFLERASAVEPAFHLTPENAPAVAGICTVLDGIPLALELAAARVRVLSVGQIAHRLGDCFRVLSGSSRSAPTRQQTLKATLDWSYNLLSEPEQAAFRRLAVLPGTCSLEAAEAVCSGDGPPELDVLEALTCLVDKSLVLVQERAGEARYRLLEPVRQYGAQLLADSGEAEATWTRFAAYCVALAERAEPEFHGPRQAEWLQHLDQEFDNIRAVVRWAETRGDADVPLRLSGALNWFFWMRQHLREGQRWLEASLARESSAAPRVRAKALFAVAMVCSFLGETTKGSAFGQEALELYQELGDTDGLAWTTITLSHIAFTQGDLPRARSVAEEALAYARASGSSWLLGQALTILGQIVRRQGDAQRSAALHQDAVAAFQRHGDRWGAGFVSAIEALAALEPDTIDLQRLAALSSIQLYWEQEDHLAVAGALEYLAGRGGTGQAEERVKLLAAAATLRRSLGAPPPIGERDDIERHLAAARDELGEARFRVAWDEGAAMRLEQVVASALKLEQSATQPAPATPASMDSGASAARRRAPGPSDALTRREREVAVLLARGYTDRQIAAELNITEGTAGVHVHHILEKLRLRSRVQVVDWALTQNLIDARPD